MLKKTQNKNTTKTVNQRPVYKLISLYNVFGLIGIQPKLQLRNEELQLKLQDVTTFCINEGFLRFSTARWGFMYDVMPSLCPSALLTRNSYTWKWTF